MSLRAHFDTMFEAANWPETMFLVPYRHSDSGWFDWQPMSPIHPLAVWNLSASSADYARIETVRRRSGYDWRRVVAFRGKEDAGHEEPWLRFLAGDNPTYPEAILQESYAQVCRRLALIREDGADLCQVNIHHWQEHKPGSHRGAGAAHDGRATAHLQRWPAHGARALL